MNISAGRGFAPVQVLPGKREPGLLLICDHASNDLPAEYGDLGVEAQAFERHIAFDIGVGDVTRKLAAELNVPAVLSTFSRLLIDPNRGEDDPTLIMKLSDGVIVPGNRNVDEQEAELRTRKYYAPYHAEIDRQIDLAIEDGKIPVVLSIHSFTPRWRGQVRKWHAGVLWDKDGRFAQPLIGALEGQGDLVVGDNAPYSGRLQGDCLYRHGTLRGIAHALLEIRQDLIGDDAGIDEWTGRLAGMLPDILAGVDDLHRIKKFGSHADRPETPGPGRSHGSSVGGE